MSDIRLTEGTAPATPPANTVILYCKADGRFYFKADDGIEYPLKAVGAGTGDVSAFGTPLDNQVAVWTDATTIEGDANFTYDGVQVTTPKISGTAGGNLTFNAPTGFNIAFQVNDVSFLVVNDTTGIYPLTDGALDLGSNTLRWDQVYSDSYHVTNYVYWTESTLVGSLPSASVEGQIYRVNDALAPVVGEVVTGGGALFALVVSDGTNWRVLGGDAAGGNVSNTGTPANDQVAVWTDATTVEGSANLTYSATQFKAGNFVFNTDQTVGAGQDNYVLTYDDASGEIGLEASAGGGGGGLTPTFQTTNYTASAGEIVYADSSGGAITITLPITPTGDDRVVVVDATGNAGTNAITIARNGETINGNASDFDLDQDFAQVDLAYDGTGTDWKHALTSGTPTPDGQYKDVKNETGTTYDFVLTDVGKLVTMNNAAAITATIPANSSVSFPIGSRIDIMQLGAGQVTIAITTDTLNGGTKINAQYESVTITKIAATTWVVTGGVA